MIGKKQEIYYKQLLKMTAKGKLKWDLQFF